jgi:predicted GNAT family acetyltransferase
MPWLTTASPVEFLAAAGGFLRVRRAENTILLTVSDLFVARGETRARFGWWESPGGGVQGAFLHLLPYPVVVSDLPGEAVEGFVKLSTDVNGFNVERTLGEALAAALPMRVSMRTRLYRLEALTPPDPAPPGRARVAGPADRDQLTMWYSAFLTEIEGPSEDPAAEIDERLGYGGLTVWETDGVPVSMAGRTRIAAGMARIGPVYTPDALRGRGYGSAVTAAASRGAQELADEVVLFTDLANPTSNGIYQRIGYRPVQDRVVLTRSDQLTDVAHR